MIREFERIYSDNGNGGTSVKCNAYENGKFIDNGYANYGRYTPSEIMNKDKANMQKFGWTLYDMEEPNVLKGWKEF